MLSDWEGNYVTPNHLAEFQMSIPRWREPDDVTVVLLTRFWVGPAPLPEGRWNLWSRYALSSILAQTRRPDLVVVLASEPYAEIFPVEHLGPGFRVVPMPTRGYGSALRSGLRRGLDEFPVKRRLIVARLDSDDAIAEDFCEGLVKFTDAAALDGGVMPTYLTYTNGIQYAEETGEARLDVRSDGHFHAVLQDARKPIIGPHLHAHSEIWRQHEMPVVPIVTRYPMWCEVVHGGNAVNRMREGPVLAQGWSERFGI